MINEGKTRAPIFIKRRSNYKALYQSECIEKQALLKHIKTATIRKDAARLIFKREKMKADFYSQDAKSVNRKILIIKNLLFEIKQYINHSDHGHVVQLSNIVTSIDVLYEYVICADSAVTEIVSNGLKHDIFDFAITVISKKINRLNIDEPYLSIQREDFYEGAIYILNFIIKLRDEIEPDEPAPSEDTFDYDLNIVADQIRQELAMQTQKLNTGRSKEKRRVVVRKHPVVPQRH